VKRHRLRHSGEPQTRGLARAAAMMVRSTEVPSPTQGSFARALANGRPAAAAVEPVPPVQLRRCPRESKSQAGALADDPGRTAARASALDFAVCLGSGRRPPLERLSRAFGLTARVQSRLEPNDRLPRRRHPLGGARHRVVRPLGLRRREAWQNRQSNFAQR
jgi:hypothetical protein